MYDRSLLLELLLEIEEAIRRIERRFEGIERPEDFISDNNGLDRLDGISMMLITISENIRRIQKLVGNDFFAQYPEVSWSEVKGIRNVLSHDYFDIDPDEIYNVCSNEIGILKQVLERIRYDIFQ
jgi:uncharacterized protein with HEPN domain